MRLCDGFWKKIYNHFFFKILFFPSSPLPLIPFFFVFYTRVLSPCNALMSTKLKANNSPSSPKKRLTTIDQNASASTLVQRKSPPRPPPQDKTTDILMRLPFELFTVVASFLSSLKIVSNSACFKTFSTIFKDLKWTCAMQVTFWKQCSFPLEITQLDN